MTVTQARQRWAKRRSQYAVGYIHSGNLLFFARYSRKPDPDNSFQGGAAIDPMSLKQAKQFLSQMPCPSAAIFQLVPVAVGGGKKR